MHFASLPDGSNYADQTALDAKAKDLVVTTTNSNYQKLTKFQDRYGALTLKQISDEMHAAMRELSPPACWLCSPRR